MHNARLAPKMTDAHGLNDSLKQVVATMLCPMFPTLSHISTVLLESLSSCTWLYHSCSVLQGNFEKPDEEELAQTAKETAAALNLVVTGKLAAAQPKNLPKQPGAATYIKYTPQQQGPQYASGARERTIKMQDMPVDPMEPPKFRHKKVSNLKQIACMH